MRYCAPTAGWFTICFWSRSSLRSSRNIRGITTTSRPCFLVLKRSGRSMRVVAPWFALNWNSRGDGRQERDRSMTSTQMRAAVLTAHGSPLQIDSVPRPETGEGLVLVRVKASAVNPLDLKISKGQAAHARHPLPAILGIDVAG